MHGRIAGIGVAEEVAFLKEPGAWPARPASVNVVETHLSWVFLVGDEAWKLKKPVRFENQDLRSLEARRRSCGIEVRVDERLAPGVYLGCVPLAVLPTGALAVGRRGTPIDWLVRMRRLPADLFLNVRDPRRGGRRAASARGRAGVRPVPPPQPSGPPIAGARCVALLLSQVHAATERLCHPAAEGPLDTVRAVHDALLAAIDGHGDLLGERAAAGRLVEGHGNLRPEHVCLLPVPVAIDCLEFDLNLRTLDAVDELGFLALECERLGAPGIGAVFLDTWREEAHDDPPAELLAFHQAMRALGRASVPARRLEVRRGAGGDPPDEVLRDRIASWLASAELRLGVLAP